MAVTGSVWRLLLIGLVFHLVYIGTVFDCYFTSPVVHGMRQHSIERAEAKRLVLIVGDGLRADLLLAKNGFSMISDSPETIAPHLRSIVETRGAFGISHTRVPTESRPGHVALIGGMYEDVSAVTKGWKTNPVDFDSVFNQSSTTYSFGSPDILPMFARGATPGKVKIWCYDEDEEDFTKDATALDLWVLDHLAALFHNATVDPQLNNRLRRDKTVFFLHLLGLDTTGHSYRPHSKEYMANIQVVDGIVNKTEELFREFYADNETAFIFTADHGMSQIGNHGDGDLDNTRTPLIAWGKGVRGPLPDSSPSSHDEYSKPWGLTHLVRRDVEQADVAALMSTLIGVNMPINSVGVLPDVDPTKPGYLLPREGEKTQAAAALVNAKAILEHYRIKHDEKRTHSLFYKQYSFFTAGEASEEVPGDAKLTAIEGLIQQGAYYQARLHAKELIEHTLEGLRYLQTYDRLMIRGIVIAAYLGWIAFGAVSILLPPSASQSLRSALPIHLFTTIALGAFWALFTKQRSPWSFYVYIVFPCYFWDQVLVRAGGPLLRNIRHARAGSLAGYVLRGTLVVAALQSMVAGYTHRSIWSAWFAVIGILWPLLSWPRELLSENRQLLLMWMTACLFTAVFPLLSVHQKENLPIILFSSSLIYAIGVIGLLYTPYPDIGERRRFGAVICVLLFEIGWSLFFTILIVRDLQEKWPVPRLYRFLGWCTFLAGIVTPFVYPAPRSNPHGRVLSFFLGFGVCFVWLTIRAEGLFYIAYSLTLGLWVEVESALRPYTLAKDALQPVTAAKAAETAEHAKDASTYRPHADDLRIAVFFLLFVQVAFFGTGKSFYLEPVYRLVPIFSPFLMAALLIFKIVAPYIILATAFSILNARLDLPPFSLVLVALTLTDIMTITFFLNVTDTGSWLEIGQTISFFCIGSLLLVWSAGICALGELLMAGQPRGALGLDGAPDGKKVR
ncbi:GPI ethanolamine phosphate transferase 1 [Trametes pubescens]|uniref:GPI ethanolamine phosphate transferase 1 n=1 Tax=Trametes pubescens TaxID=154538 RepID=A0A1M2VMD7_TRAPU|nr:GPI ethanolamine phosphate transferase 1 [Trametes pubescens]